MRRKKKHLGQLNLSSSIKEVPQEKKEDKFKEFEVIFQKVLDNYHVKQGEFTVLKSKTTVDLADMNKEKSL